MNINRDLVTGIAFVVGAVIGLIGSGGGIGGAVLTGAGFAVVTMVAVSIWNSVAK